MEQWQTVQPTPAQQEPIWKHAVTLATQTELLLETSDASNTDGIEVKKFPGLQVANALEVTESRLKLFRDSIADRASTGLTLTYDSGLTLTPEFDFEIGNMQVQQRVQ